MHEMPNPVFLGEKLNKINMSSAEIFLPTCKALSAAKVLILIVIIYWSSLFLSLYAYFHVLYIDFRRFL